MADATTAVEGLLRQPTIWRARRALLDSRLLGVAGCLQRDGQVVQLRAARLYNLNWLLGTLPVVSRDFR